VASTQDILGLIGKRMQRPCRIAAPYDHVQDLPPIPDLIRRIDRALLDRRAL